MTNSMKVSIVILAYNEEKYIRKCLESIAKQIEKPDEVIIVDNNCTDNTVEIARQYGARIVKEEKQGMIYARNAGFNNAKFEILGRLDADTVVPENWVAKVKENFQDQSIVALSGPISIGTPISYFASILIFKLLSIFILHNALFGPNIGLRKSAWENIKNDVCLKDKDVHEDVDLAIHVAAQGKIKFDKKLIMKASRFRYKAFFTEYIVRYIKMVFTHRKIIFQIYPD